MKDQTPLKIADDQNVIIEIVQAMDGTITLRAEGQHRVDMFHMVGIIEAAKADILARTSGDQPMVEITIDELDVQLNPNSKMNVGDKMPIPVESEKVRQKLRKQAKMTVVK
jgi:hypothetical protein